MSAEVSAPSLEAILDHEKGFGDFGLDARVVRAIGKLGFAQPTLIQSRAIPLALDGKDILARAHTGSGKTLAYSVPIVQRILEDKLERLEQGARPGDQGIVSVILVPTKELCEQVRQMIAAVLHYCSGLISVSQLAGEVVGSSTSDVKKLSGSDIIVSTPAKLLAMCKNKSITLRKTLKYLVLDEADLLLSYGYDEDIRKLLKFTSSKKQCFLMSATLSDDIEELKKLILHSPVTLKLEAGAEETENKLHQFAIAISENNKYLLAYALIRLRIITGRTIFFVNDTDKGYKLKLFFEQFSIKSTVLNAEMPLNSRHHIIQQFNRGVFDLLITTDEDKKTLKRKKNKVKDADVDVEFGASRGVDFKNVSTVINFDFPASAKTYTHRVGRTARGGQGGTAVSFVTPDDEKTSLEVVAYQEKRGAVQLQQLPFQLSEINGFRYRVEDAVRAVTRHAIREARVKELKKEIMNSEKLKTFFEENPDDLDALRHDSASQAVRVQSHLKDVPRYLIPPTLASHFGSSGGSGGQRSELGGGGGGGSGERGAAAGARRRKRGDDPLRSYAAGGEQAKKMPRLSSHKYYKNVKGRGRGGKR